VKRRKNSCSWPQRKKENKAMMKNEESKENFKKKSREFFLSSFGLFFVVNLMNAKFRTK